MKKILALLCAVSLIAVFGVGCSSNGKTLKVATNAEFSPWEFMDKDQKIVGADIDIMNEVAKQMGMKVDYKNMEFDGVVSSIPSGNCDLAISGLTINPGREKSVDFSDSYYTGAAQILIVNKNDTLFTGTTKAELDEQLKGKRIGVCSGFTGQEYANGNEDWQFKKIENAKVSIFDNVGLAIQDLKNGKIDCIIMDDSVAKDSVSKAENQDTIKLVDIPLTVEKYAIAMKKGNTDMAKKINAALKDMKDSGKLDEILKKWKL